MEDERAVLICPPWGVEHQYAHRALRVLAQRLASAGSHVLRFDYSGSGDSWGRDSEADLDQWVVDVDLAARELRIISGKPRLDMVGLRLGGTVALRAGLEFGGVDRLVLWDPVLNGADHCDELFGARGDSEGQAETGGAMGEVDLGQHVVSARFIDQMEQVNITQLDAASFGNVLFLLTREDPVTARSQRLLCADTTAEFLHLPQPAPWEEDTSIWGGHVPVEALKTILSWMGRS